MKTTAAVDDAAKIVGCWRHWPNRTHKEDLSHDPDPMRRAVAFCQVIEVNKGAQDAQGQQSKNIANMFQAGSGRISRNCSKRIDNQEAISLNWCAKPRTLTAA
jgi:predicted helicase